MLKSLIKGRSAVYAQKAFAEITCPITNTSPPPTNRTVSSILFQPLFDLIFDFSVSASIKGIGTHQKNVGKDTYCPNISLPDFLIFKCLRINCLRCQKVE
jgi:hypothetical protein